MEEASEKAIIVEHLTKNFKVSQKKAGLKAAITSFFSPKQRVVTAVKDISFTIQKGELVGFIGPNGAGKTTTLKILSGLLYPSAGFIQVLGFDPWQKKAEFLKQIALVMGQKSQLCWDLPATDSFELIRAIYEIPKKKYKESLAELVSLLSVSRLLDIQVRKLSLGQRMRLELIASLLHEPKVIFLDEPTVGLDVIGQQAVRDFIFDYNKKKNTTILLTSHNMDDLVGLAKRVIVVNKGQIVFNGRLDELVSQFMKEKIIKVYLSKETDIKKFEEIGRVKRYDYPLAVISIPHEVAAVAASELLQNFPIADITIEEEPIEEIIRRVFRSKVLSGKIKRKKV